MVQPLWKTVGQFLTKLNIILPYDPAIILLACKKATNQFVSLISLFLSLSLPTASLTLSLSLEIMRIKQKTKRRRKRKHPDLKLNCALVLFRVDLGLSSYQIIIVRSKDQPLPALSSSPSSGWFPFC